MRYKAKAQMPAPVVSRAPTRQTPMPAPVVSRAPTPQMPMPRPPVQRPMPQPVVSRAPTPQTPPTAMPQRKMKSGGSVMPAKMGAVKTAAPSRDGVASKGKTKGKMVKMAYGGSC